MVNPFAWQLHFKWISAEKSHRTALARRGGLKAADRLKVNPQSERSVEAICEMVFKIADIASDPDEEREKAHSDVDDCVDAFQGTEPGGCRSKVAE